MKPLWDPEYAALVARRNAGIKAVGKPAIEAAYRQRQCLAALCDCDGVAVNAMTHRDWCCYRTSCEQPAPTFDQATQAATAALMQDMGLPPPGASSSTKGPKP